MLEFKFTQEQIENLKSWKNSLSLEEAKKWYEDKEKVEIQTKAILSSEDFKQGKDLPPDGTEKTLLDSDTVLLKPGHRYGRAPKFKRG